MKKRINNIIIESGIPFKVEKPITNIVSSSSTVPRFDNSHSRIGNIKLKSVAHKFKYGLAGFLYTNIQDNLGLVFLNIAKIFFNIYSTEFVDEYNGVSNLLIVERVKLRTLFEEKLKTTYKFDAAKREKLVTECINFIEDVFIDAGYQNNSTNIECDKLATLFHKSIFGQEENLFATYD